MVDDRRNQEKLSSGHKEGKIAYKPNIIEPKWQRIWEQQGIYSPNLDASSTLSIKKPFGPSASLRAQGNPFYNLMMFPYPSAEGMHVGNMYAFTGADVYGRFKRMQGFDVFEPIGLDGFGIHSENYAIKIGRHPKEQAKLSESNFYRQLRATGNGFDWSRKLETYDPRYYKWTQWLFIQLFKAGLAYRAKAKVNWCPSCKTVLADEQVVKGQKNVGKTRQDVYGKEDVILGSPAQRDDSRINPHPNPLPKGEGRGEGGQARMTSEDISTDESQVCERCGTEVEKRELEQWFFRITKYANRLLANLAKLDWSEKVKIAQKQWIGKSEGAKISFPVIASRSEAISDFKGIATDSSSPRNDKLFIEVFTTRPDTLYGATFLVLSPEHPLVASLLSSKFNPSTSLRTGVQSSKLDEVKRYVDNAKKRTEQERMAEGKEKTGVFTGLYGVNPVNQEKIPIWIADYVLMGYGTGAIMAVPAHDQRDFEFAKKYNLSVRIVIASEAKQSQTSQEIASSRAKPDPRNDNFEKAYEDEGRIINSGEWNWWRVPEDIGKVISWLEKKDIGKREVTYHLRDWLISRQRYWGPPIPMVYCERCAHSSHPELVSGSKSPKNKMPKQVRHDKKNTMAGWSPVPEKDLPVLLPDVKDWKPLGTGKSPLANHPEFYKVKCPQCGREAKRETDISDNFLDSSWYFLRYVSTDIDSSAFDIKRAKKWLPVKMYIGGPEHSVLHLLYSRFITMVLCDLGLISFEEPFSRFYAHGLLIREGAKMSKSKGNVVVPDEYIKKFGADTLRMYLMFLGPFSQGGDFYDTGIEGMYRFAKRVWRLFSEYSENSDDQTIRRPDTSDNLKRRQSESSEFSERTRVMHKTIKKVTEDINGLRYNTAIASLMEWYNYLSSKFKVSAKGGSASGGQSSKLSYQEAEAFLKLLSPFAPHMTEELWQQLKVSNDIKVSKVSNGERAPFDTFGTSGTFDTSSSIHLQPWPTYDPKFLQEDEVTIVVQVNGKLRDTVRVQSSKFKVKSYIQELARASEKVKKHLTGKTVRKVVYVQGKVINFVTDDR